MVQSPVLPAESAPDKVPVNLRNFRVMLDGQLSLVKQHNAENVKLDYSAAKIDKSTEHLAREV